MVDKIGDSSTPQNQEIYKKDFQPSRKSLPTKPVWISTIDRAQPKRKVPRCDGKMPRRHPRNDQRSS